METWGHSGFRFLTEGPHRVDLFAFYSYSHLMYWNENTTCFKYLFHSSWSTPWATKLPNVAVCTLSFPTSPFLKETTVFLSRHLAERRDEAKWGWWGQERRLRMSDRRVRASGRRTPQTRSCRLWCSEGMWKAAREIQIHSPGNWLFSCISERHSLAGADSYCFLLLPLRVGAKEMWGKEAPFGGWR